MNITPPTCEIILRDGAAPSPHPVDFVGRGAHHP